MMNRDNRNDKIRKIAKKGLTLSLCAVLAGGLAAGSFEGVSKITGWDTATTVKLTAVLIPTAVQQKEAWIYLRLHQKHYLPSYLLQPNPFRKYRVIMECTECTDMLLSSRNRK